jgi:hypothetical protein
MNATLNAATQTEDFEFAALNEARNHRSALWLNFCGLKKRGFNLRSMRFFDQAIFPAGPAAEFKICAPPLGQSLLVIAQAN